MELMYSRKSDTTSLISVKTRFRILAAQLIAHGVQSQFIARIDAQISLEERLEGLQVEHQQEMAGALGKSDMRVNMALAELELCGARYQRAHREGASFEELAKLADKFNQQRLVADRRLRELLIHREAVGFRRNQILDELYPIAGKLRVLAEAA
jgi:hypothetical protein